MFPVLHHTPVCSLTTMSASSKADEIAVSPRGLLVSTAGKYRNFLHVTKAAALESVACVRADP